jgi:outer membrane protein assembly factor BamA
LRFEATAFTIRHVQNSFQRLVVLAVWTCVLSGVVNAGQPQEKARVAKIGSIRVIGQKQFSAEQVIAATGLKAGQAFDVKELDAAAERLGKSGAFPDVSYSYVPQGGLIAVQFKLEEAAKFRECVFDNFVWLTSDEIQAGLKKEVPLYIGEAPETGDVLDEIARALENLSKQKGIAVQVTRRIGQARIGDPNWSHLYTAEGASVKVQSMRFMGALTVNPEDLKKEAGRLIGRDYSLFQCGLFGTATILPFYAERGYLQAKIGTPAPQILNHPDGSSEFVVEVVFPVTEGSVYHWTAAEWTGNQVIAGADLETATSMKANDIANARKIDDGWVAVKKLYSQSGYIEAKLLPEPVFQEESRQVHYRVTVTEGAQYRMGIFQISGLPAATADRLKSRWRLKPGDVFDGSYPAEFGTKELHLALQGAGKVPTKFRMMTVPNREAHVVDVSCQFE